MKNSITLDEFWNNLKETGPEEKELFDIAEDVSAIIGSIVKARIDNKLTQRQLADICGLKQSAIARMETLQAIPRLDTLIKISRKVGIKICTTEIESVTSSQNFEYLNSYETQIYNWQPKFSLVACNT